MKRSGQMRVMGKNPQHLLLRCRQQQVATRVPGVLPPTHEGRHTAGVHELQRLPDQR
jgi:hypothetical protein